MFIVNINNLVFNYLLYKNVDEYGLLASKPMNKETLVIPDVFFEEFQNSLTIEITKNLYLKLN